MEKVTEDIDPEHYNTAKFPLEDVTIRVRIEEEVREVRALSQYFTETRKLCLYSPPPLMRDGCFPPGSKEDWLRNMEYFILDCRWLLELSHNRFWSQIIYEKSTWRGPTSFLQDAFPFYSLDLMPEDQEILKKYNLASSLVLSIISRVTTRTESETEYIGTKKFGALLYDNFLITVPILIDLCAIYGESNSKEVQRIIDNVFEVAPAYKQDFKDCLTHIQQVFRMTEEKLSIGIPPGEVVKLKEKTNYFKRPLVETSLLDVLHYVLDTCVSLSIFADFFQEAASIMHTFRLEITLVSFYETAIPSVCKNLKKLTEQGKAITEYSEKLGLVRFYILKLFHQCISSPLHEILDKSDLVGEDIFKNLGESYLGVLTEVLADQFFLKDYNSKYPIENDLDVIGHVCPDLEGVKYDYILESLRLCSIQKPRSAKPVAAEYSAERTENRVEPSPETSSMSFESSRVTGIVLDSLVTEVKDILPDLGEGFIQECLRYYNYRTSVVIDALLEDSLPPQLQCIDRQLPFIPPDEEEEEGAVALPTIRDKEGNKLKAQLLVGRKKDQYKDLAEMLDDKSFVKDMKNVYTSLGNVEDDAYDDEYDDTYDSVDVKLEPGEEEEVESEEEKPTQSRPKHWWKENVEEGGEEEPTTNGRRTGFVPFAENPEMIRARYEQRRQSKMQSRPQRPQRDVKGNAKGQGQEKEILNNRHKKDVNKSYVANHNRRKMAQHKRQQGMMPS